MRTRATRQAPFPADWPAPARPSSPAPTPCRGTWVPAPEPSPDARRRLQISGPAPSFAFFTHNRPDIASAWAAAANAIR